MDKNKVRVNKDDIMVGRVLHKDVYDERGALLLKKGYVIESRGQLDVLLDRGLYFISTTLTGQETGPESARQTEVESPFALIDDIYSRLSALHAQGAKDDYHDRIIELCERVQQASKKDADASLSAVILDKRDRYSIIHQIHCALVCDILLARQGRPAKDRLPLLAAGLTMNASMLTLQDALFLQKGRLTEEQGRAVREHPNRSVELLKDCGVTDDVWLEIVLQHHELMDRSGYPRGLGGDAICQDARMLTLADIYCANLFPRVYRPPLPPNVIAHEVLTGSRGHSVDLAMSRVFVKELGIFHPGSFVRLKNNEIAVVVRRGEKIHHPVVFSVRKANGEPIPEPRKRDCSNEDFSITASVSLAEANVHVNRRDLWGCG